ncbi:MAG: clostripain-related cysteine peptidase [Chloroflexota bacterium]
MLKFLHTPNRFISYLLLVPLIFSATLTTTTAHSYPSISESAELNHALSENDFGPTDLGPTDPGPTDHAPRPRITTTGAIGTPTVIRRNSGVRAASLEIMPQSVTDWSEDFSDSFEDDIGPFPDAWTVLDDNSDLLDRTWGIDDSEANSGTQSVWVAAGGSDGLDPASNPMPPNLDTWLTISRTIDLSEVQMADITFAMLMDTEPISDTIFVGASFDDVDYYGEYWSGDSGGWQEYTVDLSEYLGYDQIYISWFFQSNANNADDKEYKGVWIDDVTVWTYVDTGPIEASDAILNGDFETGDFDDWVVPDESTAIVEIEVNPNDGDYVAWLGGIANAEESFYQSVALPDSDITYASFGFWINQFSEETAADADLFCAGLYGTGNRSSGGTATGPTGLGSLLIDLGCLDGIDAYTTEFDPDSWWEVDYLLTGDEWELVRGQTVSLVFEMFTDERLNTTVYIDDVTVEIVTGGSAGDTLEPNDYPEEAITSTLPISYTGLTIDPDFDYDLFRVEANVGDTVVVDVDADVNGSPLDAFAYLLDADENTVCQNDDDEFSFDPYLTCKIETAGTYYAAVTSYDETGDRSQVYSVRIQRIPATDETPANPPPVVTEPPAPEPPADTWTVMIYMDGDTNLCGVYPGLVSRVEKELGGKIGPDGFLKVLVLLDRVPIFCEGDGKATRYYVQQDGQYTDNVNRWDMGEINMGDPQTMQSFIEWSMRNYPADHYYLAIDNHGAGVTGIAWDDSNRDATNKKDKLTNAELYSVLKAVTKNGSQPLDILAYEACLMGTYENAYDVRTFAKNLFFFPTVSFTNDGSYPSYMKDEKFTSATSGSEFGDIMFDVYQRSVTNLPYAMTLVNTTHISTVHSAVNNWSNALIGQLNAQRDKIALARSQAQKIDSNSDKKLTDDDQYIDLWDLADKLATQGVAVAESNALKAAIEASVTRNSQLSFDELDYKNTHGLSIFWPQTASSWYRPYINGRIYNSTRDGMWDEFLQAYFANDSRRPGMQTDPGPAERESATSSGMRELFLPIMTQ